MKANGFKEALIIRHNMKANGELNFKEALIMMLATGMMYGGAVFVLVFDNPVVGIAAAALNFLFWTCVVGFFVLFSKDTIGPLCLRSRLIISMFFWLSFCSKRFNDWAENELKKGQHESAIH